MSDVLELSKDRLLMAALEVFAEKGFQNATVREICSRVDANVAAVNYYYRSKENLYKEALMFAFRQGEKRYPLNHGGVSDPRMRLRQFVGVFLNRMLDESALGHFGKLIAHEIASPTNALDDIVDSFIKPEFALLEDIVIQCAGKTLEKGVLKRCLLSILGQCLMFKHSRPVIDRVCQEVIASREEIEACADHIASFSFFAIRQLAEHNKGQAS